MTGSHPRSARDVVQKLFRRQRTGDDTVLDDLVAHGLVNHAAGPQGREGLRTILRTIEVDLGRPSSSSTTSSVRESFVAQHVTLHGTHRESTMPLLADTPVTGQPAAWTFIHIWRFADGMLRRFGSRRRSRYEHRLEHHRRTRPRDRGRTRHDHGHDGLQHSGGQDEAPGGQHRAGPGRAEGSRYQAVQLARDRTAIQHVRALELRHQLGNRPYTARRSRVTAGPGRAEVAIDLFHHLVYAVAAGLSYQALERRFS
jgi:lactoylglutathione lyase